MLVVVTVAFAVGGDVRQLGLGGVFEAGLESRGKVVAGVEQAFKGDGAGGGSVVEEDGDGGSGREADEIRTRSIDGGVGGVGPDCIVRAVAS